MEAALVGMLEFGFPQVKAREMLFRSEQSTFVISSSTYLSDVIVVLSMKDVVVSVKTVSVSVSVLWYSRVSGCRTRSAVSLTLCCRA